MVQATEQRDERVHINEELIYYLCLQLLMYYKHLQCPGAYTFQALAMSKYLYIPSTYIPQNLYIPST